MTNTFKAAIVIVSSLFLTSCGFVYKKELIDNYFLVACDVDEQMSLDYNKDETHNQNYSTLILATVFDTKWNERFIVVKTHPADIRESLKMAYRNIHSKGSILDKINSKGYFTQQEWKEIHKVDSLSENDVDEFLKSNNFFNTKDNAKSKITLYYLLDTQNQNQDPLLFLTEKELAVALQEYHVGSLNHSQYFKDLDKY